jgi:hypothetical protein
MAITETNLPGNGTAGPFTYTFPALEAGDVYVSVDGTTKTVNTDYSLDFVNKQITFLIAPYPTASNVIRIYRVTDDEDLAATFYSGAAIRATDLNTNFTQNLYVTQESVREAEIANTTADAADAKSDTAITNSTTALSNSATALSQSNTAIANSATALSNSTTAINTANAATATANAAAAAVANAQIFVIVAAVANIPGSPSDGDAIEVTDATGIESFTPLAGIPAGFTGDSGLSVRIVYSSAGSTWNWVQYFPSDPDARYPIQGELGTAASPAYYFDANTGFYSPGADQVAISTNGAQVVRVFADGKIAVGTRATSPTANLDVETTAGARIATGHSGQSRWSIGTATTAWTLDNLDGEKLRIDSQGRVGIGTTSANELVELRKDQDTNTRLRITNASDTASATAGIHLAPYGGNWYIEALRSSTFANPLRFTFDGTERFRFTYDGRLGIGTTSPASILDINAQSPIVSVNSAPGYGSSIEFKQSGTAYGRVRFDGNDFDIGNLYSGGATIIYAGNAERARIDSSGRLLVGTSSTSYDATVLLQGSSSTGATGSSILKLCVGASTPADGGRTGSIRFADSSHIESGEIFAARDGGTWSGASKPTRLVFSTTADGASSPTERMRITQAGFTKHSNTGSYLNTAGSYHEFRSDQNNVNLLIGCTNTGSNVEAIETQLASGTSSAAYQLRHYLGGTQIAYLTSEGDWRIAAGKTYGNISDERKKTNIVDATPKLEDIKNLKVRNFEPIGEPGNKCIGFIAQEFEQVFPSLVDEREEEELVETSVLDADGNETGEYTTERVKTGETVKSIKETALIPILVKSLQEALAKIETLEAKVNALESNTP